MIKFAGNNSTITYRDLETNEKFISTLKNNALKANEISINSPLGQALFGSEVGNVVNVDCEEPYKILIMGIENPVNGFRKKELVKVLPTGKPVLESIYNPYDFQSDLLKDQYTLWLEKNGYKKYTPSGLPSTIPQYVNAIEIVILEENFVTWERLKDKIGSIIIRYDIGGTKEDIGNYKHRTVINSLKAFKRFLDECVNN